MAKITAGSIIGVVLGLILIGALITTGLTGLMDFGSTNITIGTVTSTAGAVNPTVTTLIGTVVPIMAVIGIVLLFIPKGSKKE